MKIDEELVEAMSIGAAEARLGEGCWVRAHDSERDIWRQEAEGSLSILRAAGWLLIPPLDTPEGREAVGRALGAWSLAGDSSWGNAVRAALRAAAQTGEREGGEHG